MARLFGGDKKKTSGNAGEKELKEIEVELRQGHICALSRGRERIFTMAKLLKQQGGRLTLGVYADREYGFYYAEGDIVEASFVQLRVRYKFNIKIIGFREASPENDGEDFEIDEASNQLDSIYGYDKYIVEAAAVSLPEKGQMREFFRMPLRISIYYKIMEDGQSGEKIKERATKSRGMQYLEEEGYLKLTTADISAGGFRSRTRAEFTEGGMLDCILIVGYDALPVTAKILKAKPDANDPYLYDVRAIFCDVSDSVRDKIMKYVLQQQKQQRARFLDSRP
ncbi:MAG: PilZ domain-containing protein [Oscillospiraceae bacterium]|nr:PilZ domain-containing protein [Oscillospiraceae bacterium]